MTTTTPPIASLVASSKRTLAAGRIVAVILTLYWFGPLALTSGVAASLDPATAYRPDRILIQPRPHANRQEMARLHASEKVRVLREFQGISGIQVLELPAGSDVPGMVHRYKSSNLIEFAEPDYRLHPAVAPNDAYYANGSLWHLNNTGQSGGKSDADIDAPEAWDVSNTASNIIVAIVDSGIRHTHEDLAPNMWLNPGEIAGNGVDDDGDGLVDNVYGINAAANNGNTVDLLGHGTQVAGFVGAVGNNSLGVAGVAWRVKLMACRFYDDAGLGFISDAVQAVDFARANGAHVINASFISTNYSSAFYTAINNCRSAGIIFVAAAGNYTINNEVVPHYPASFNLDNIVAVAATSRTDDLASFSNYGATSVDLAAPGHDVFTTASSANNAYILTSGTSFSSPIVAGAFALMRARYPTTNYRQLINQMLAATDPLPSLTGKCVTGGRLNLARALGPSVAASFTASPLAGAVPLTVRFTNTSFGTTSSLLWNFGDGTTSTVANPVHIYETPGNFTVSLTATANNGATSTTNRSVFTALNYQMTNATFSWIDPASMVSLNLTGDAVGSQALPFTFQFYGQDYSTIYVGANGLLGFNAASLTSAANTDLPSTAGPNNIICPFWDDLNPAIASVRFGTIGTEPNRKVVISWLATAGVGSPPASFTFQAVLEETSNHILFQYLNVQPGNQNASAEGKSATVGIEHASGLVAHKYSYLGSAPLANNQAIRFKPAGNAAPVVTFTSPVNGSVMMAPASFTLTATAIDSDGSIGQVEFFQGTTSLGVDTSNPFSATVNGLAAGSYTFSAVATDNVGAKATNSLSLIVNALPTISISSPTNGQSFTTPAQLVVTANATDADGNVARVEFFLGATKLGEDTSSPYSFAWTNVAAGNYSLSARAIDNRGASNVSSAILIAVTNPPPSPVIIANVSVQGSTPSFSFLADAGRPYTVQFASDLNSADWQTLTNLTGNGENALIVDPQSDPERRYYRVRSP